MPADREVLLRQSVTPYYDEEGVTLYHGRCEDILPQLNGPVDLVLTDLPYGMTDCKWDTPLPLDALWAQWRRLLSPTGAVLLTASQPFTSALVMSNPTAFKHEWIWEKNAGSNFGTVKRQPMKEHESVLVFAWGRYHYEPIMQERSGGGLARVQSGVVNYATKAEAYSSGGLTATASSHRPDLRYPRSIQRFNRDRGLHPTQKPLDLMAYMIRTYSPPGSVVLDACAGSGTTLLAAKNMGRRAIGVEIDQAYCDVAVGRFASEADPQGVLDVA